jgi:O-antigen/teichoic acid export membrane protein
MRERLFFFRAKMDITTYGRIKIFQYLFSILVLLGLIVSNNLNEKSMLVGIGVSYLAVSFIYNFNGKAKKALNFEDDLPAIETKEIIRYALPLSFNVIVVWLLGAADQMLIDMYFDAMTLTYYSVGFRIINVIRIGTGVIMEYWPRFYFERMVSRDYSAIKTMRILFLGVVAVLSVGAIVFSKPLYWLMGASQYSNMRWMFSMLAAAELFRQWGSINITFQSYMKNTSINVLCLSVLGGIKLIINWMFIKEAGVSILFHTTLGCYFLYYMCSLYFGICREKKYMQENLL